MAKVFTTETKVKLCGLYVREPFDYVFDKKDYDLFLQLFTLTESLREYQFYLYEYGAFSRHQSQKCKTELMQQKFEEKDRDFYTWVKMLEQLEYFLSLPKANTYYYQQSKQSGKKELYLPDRYSKERFQEVMVKFLIEEVCVFENARQKGEKIYPEDVNLERIQLQLKIARQNDYALNGTKRGYSTPLPLIESQVSIRLLSYLLRIDHFIMDMSYSQITDLPLRKEEYSFIYRFLNYFDLLAYEKSSNTTTPEKLIKERLKSFPQVKLLYDTLLTIEDRINQAVIFLKEQNM